MAGATKRQSRVVLSAIVERPAFHVQKELLSLQCHEAWGGVVPLASGRIGGLSLLDDARASCSDAVKLLFVKEEVSVSSGIVANFFRTCLRAGRLMGLL
jgi:hypothetical protein